ncbi:MAG: iron permease [Gammaproteobacteria bacterium]|nr:iron permease [Gammaproteobacteria bacterium]
MSDKPMNKSRRDAVKTMLGGLAAVPVMNLVATAAAYAQELPAVDPATDPTAQALKYVHDASTADRAAAARPGLPPAEQICNNCNFHQPYEEDGWVACTLFPGKKVATEGWCTSWTLQAG